MTNLYAHRVVPEPLHVAVEQAIARGRDDEWIQHNIGVTVADIGEVRAYMDRVINEPDLNGHRAGGIRRQHLEHGTRGRAEQHRRDHEPMCGPCRQARNKKVA